MRQLQSRIAELEKLVGRLPPAAAPSPAAAAPEAERVRWKISGFADFTSISRSTFSGTGISTGFGAIPLERSADARLGEFRGAGNHSRLSFRLDTRLAGRELTAYAETDFLAGTTANVFAGSNPHGLRMRLYWVRWGGRRWDLVAGQSWSLLAPNRRGISPEPSQISNTMLLDPNYNVGLVWTRQGTVRLTRHWSRLHLAASVENAEPNITDPRQAPPDTRGLGTRAAPGANHTPDFIVKAAYDAPWVHLEAAAIGRVFRVYSPGLDRTDQAFAGGGSLAGVVFFGPRVQLVSQNFLAAGGGRYAQGVTPDLVVRPDGRVVPVTTVSLLEGIEVKAGHRVDVYGYWGLVYGKRAAYRTPAGGWVGFGAPHGSTVDNRTVAQTSVGFRHFFWRQEGYGSLSYALNYSYLVRKLWEPVAAGGAGRLHMVYTNLRYNLP